MFGVFEEQKRCHCGKDRMYKGMRTEARQQGGRRLGSALGHGLDFRFYSFVQERPLEGFEQMTDVKSTMF